MTPDDGMAASVPLETVEVYRTLDTAPSRRTSGCGIGAGLDGHILVTKGSHGHLYRIPDGGRT
jgi:hypothetical protein